MSNLVSMLGQVGGVCPDPGTDEAMVRVVLHAVERGVLDDEGAREVLQMLGLAPGPVAPVVGPMDEPLSASVLDRHPTPPPDGQQSLSDEARSPQ